MQRIRVKGTAAYRSTPAEYMRDMLRYDDGKIEAIWDYPTGKRFESIPLDIEPCDLHDWECECEKCREYICECGCINETKGLCHACINDIKDPRDQDGGCPWCGQDCPDAGKPQGCWYQGCPDFPHENPPQWWVE